MAAPALETPRVRLHCLLKLIFFLSSRRRHTRSLCDWSSDVCSSDLWRAFDEGTCRRSFPPGRHDFGGRRYSRRSEEHTSELQSHSDIVCRLLLEKKKKKEST